MCIIVSRPPGKHVKQRYLKNCWEANDDGAGIMFVHNKKVNIIKGLMTFATFLEAWKSVPETLPTVAHFRIRTHGESDAANTHPFEVVPGRLAVAHNGILPIKAVDKMSDTATFVELVLKKLPWGWHRSNAMLHLLDNYCGSSNKLAILDETGKVTLVNEEAGTWDEGVWYSGYSFRTGSRYTRNYPVAPYSGAWGDDDEYEDIGPYPFSRGAAVQQTIAPTVGTPGGTDTHAKELDDEILDSSELEANLRQQSREARTAGKAVEADKWSTAADAVRDERVAAIREATIGREQRLKVGP